MTDYDPADRYVSGYKPYQPSDPTSMYPSVYGAQEPAQPAPEDVDFDFTPTDEDLVDGPELGVMPKGRYQAIVSAAQWKPTRDRTGKYLELKLVIQQPEQFKNRVVFDRLNLINKNPEAVVIARRSLASLCLGLGLPGVHGHDLQPLLDKPFDLNLGIEKGTGEYADKNKVTSYVKPPQAAQPVRTPPQGGFQPPRVAQPAQPQATQAAPPTQNPGPPRVAQQQPASNPESPI